MTDTDHHIVVANRLERTFGDVTALQATDLEIRQGEWINIMGHSGSGKTTLLNLLGGLDRPTSGELLVDGQDLLSLDEPSLARFRRESVGMVFQQHYLVPYLSSLENVMMAQYFHSVVDTAEARHALERVGLGHRLKNRPGQLSGGEQQRVCIARALINAPRLLLADEPTGNLDHENADRVMELLRELHKEEAFSVVLVSHNPDLAPWRDRLLLMREGVLLATGEGEG